MNAWGLVGIGNGESSYVSTMSEGAREVIASWVGAREAKASPSVMPLYILLTKCITPSVMPPKYNKQRGDHRNSYPQGEHHL